ncbi:MAG: ATP-binding protein [Clostridiales Family XIII bacterium]|nr:ATP-binding protein [Clostridiales Family XIII bacterium]
MDLYSECILFSDVSDDAAVACALALRDAGESADAAAWVSFQRAMLSGVGFEKVRATYWQNHLCALVGASDNPFSRVAEKGVYAGLEGLTDAGDVVAAVESLTGPRAGLFRLATAELARVKAMYAWEFGRAPDDIASITASPDSDADPRRQAVHEALTTDDDLVSAVMLAAYYHSHGSGALEAHDNYYWDDGFAGVGAGTKDAIRFSDLIGLERQTESLVENTEFLLSGLPASNMLLYGDAGAGKSSSVKALAAEYADRGLKLVAIPKARISELPEALAAASERGLKFIFFIDDLSFEEGESSYKSFKSVIEGGVSARPDNVVICVTSNRRNIVKEVWKDREHQDDVHLRDNLQEKRSLADRFGLTIVYSAPDKDEYLAIVTALAEKAGLVVGESCGDGKGGEYGKGGQDGQGGEYGKGGQDGKGGECDEDELKAASLTWAVRHGGRSGRTARQFIDYRVSRSAMNDKEGAMNDNGGG